MLFLLGSILAPIFNAFSTPKILSFFNGSWGVFWEAFEAPDPPKWSSRVHAVLIFRKSPFSFRTRFFMKFGLKTSPKRLPKWLQKQFKNQWCFLMKKRSIFYPKWSLKGRPNGTRGRPKEVQKGSQKETRKKKHQN